MSRPLIQVTLANDEGGQSSVQALFDTGSQHTIVRESLLPPGTLVSRFRTPRRLAMATEAGKLEVIGRTVLDIHIGERMVEDNAYIAQDLRREMLVGAGTMQKWDISIVTEDGLTTVRVGLDSRDPEANEVL